ncbi:hypothetical protein [Burkholderia pseudomallei]|uniref:hypothetical protein n=1 Tax=Burkholderia pseudomallei TaxID=28450 RepID=UPI0016211817|nr:hypothetical protein [Burkholderia pseudomallei]
MNRSAPIAAARVAPCAMRRRARNDRCEASRSFHAALLRIHVVPLRITDGQMARAAQHHIAKQLLAETEKSRRNPHYKGVQNVSMHYKGIVQITANAYIAGPRRRLRNIKTRFPEPDAREKER